MSEILKLPDAGTHSTPWICFTGEPEMGISVVDGKIVYIVDGGLVDAHVWLDICHERGQIDLPTKWALRCAMGAGGSATGALRAWWGARSSSSGHRR